MGQTTGNTKMTPNTKRLIAEAFLFIAVVSAFFIACAIVAAD